MRMVRKHDSKQRSLRQRGFTLLEVLVVVAVLILLVSIMMPAFHAAREIARRTVCVANLKHIAVGVVTYGADYGEYAPRIMDPMGTNAPRPPLSRSGAYTQPGLLLRAPAISAPTTLPWRRPARPPHHRTPI